MPLISVVVPVFNKSGALWNTLESLHRQEGRGHEFDLEFVLFDDASTDDSADVVARWSAHHQQPVIWQSSQVNQGPARSLNAAIQQASGDLVFVFDADDIAPANAIVSLLAAMTRTGADYVYGRSCKTPEPVEQVMRTSLPEGAPCYVDDDPLRLTLQRHIVHPVVLARRSVMQTAGGADPDIFIQDESLAFRLALHAKRAALIDAPCRYVLRQANVTHLSANRAQQHHDQYRAALATRQALPVDSPWRGKLAGRCLSAAWKARREAPGARAFLVCYLFGKLAPEWVFSRLQSRLNSYFSTLPGVRRPMQLQGAKS